MSSQKLLKVLTTPTKIASALDWRKASGSVLSLDIHKDRIGLSIASHPSFGEGSCSSLESIPLADNKGKVTEECQERLAKIVKENKVCGIVVSWPLQPDTGRMGAACGRVLHTLDRLLQDASIASSNRPLCLWDGAHSTGAVEDHWGRSVAYTRTSTKTVHKASEEQYHHDENMVASKVWEDFCKAHWPEMYSQEPRKSYHAASSKFSAAAAASKQTSNSWQNDSWEESSSYVNAALL